MLSCSHINSDIRYHFIGYEGVITLTHLDELLDHLDELLDHLDELLDLFNINVKEGTLSLCDWTRHVVVTNGLTLSYSIAYSKLQVY